MYIVFYYLYSIIYRIYLTIILSKYLFNQLSIKISIQPTIYKNSYVTNYLYRLLIHIYLFIGEGGIVNSADREAFASFGEEKWRSKFLLKRHIDLDEIMSRCDALQYRNVIYQAFFIIFIQTQGPLFLVFKSKIGLGFLASQIRFQSLYDEIFNIDRFLE